MKRLSSPLLALGLILGCQDEIITSQSEDSIATTSKSSASSVQLTVMTRNMYIGADVDQIIEETDPKPTILLGDLNTPAPDSPVYGYFIAAGYRDAWTSLGDKADNGLTCCHVPELDNAVEEFHERIDLILVNHVDKLTPASGKLIGKIKIVGKYPDEKIDTGLWPSDHAGVAATLQFPRPQ